VPEGSVRIEAIPSNVNLDAVAFDRPDNKIAAVLFNSGRATTTAAVICYQLSTRIILISITYHGQQHIV